MKRLFLLIAVICIGLLPSCTKPVDTSVSLVGTSWTATEDGTKVDLVFQDVEFVLTIVALTKQDGVLPGEGFRLRGSYEYQSPEATLYCRTIEYLFNDKVEGVQSARDMYYTAVVVNNVLSLYDSENDFMGTLELK